MILILTFSSKNSPIFYKWETKDALRLVSLEVEKMMKDYIIRELYQKYEPKEYMRSYNYINSLTVKKVYKNNIVN